MPLYTPNFALPYPAPLDEPCDFAQQWCDLSSRFQTLLDGYHTIIDRTTPAIPVARLLITEPTSFSVNQELIFDTLSVDTAGWVDFDADPQGITVDRGGYYYLIANAAIPTLGVANAEYGLDISGIDDQDATIDNGVAGTVMGLNTAGYSTINILTRFAVTVTSGTGTGTVTVNSAMFSIFWHSDEATP